MNAQSDELNRLLNIGNVLAEKLKLVGIENAADLMLVQKMLLSD